MKHDVNKLRQRYGHLHRQAKGNIIINPLQTAGRLPPEVEPLLAEFADGYSVCDYCKGSLTKIANPPIKTFVQEDLPEFLGCDAATITHGAREAKFMVMHALTKPGDAIILDGNRHYSTHVAAERAGLEIIPVPHNGDLERRVNVEDYIPLIKRHQPKLILLTYPDGDVGNLPDAERLGQIAQEYDVPFLLNAAYAIGRMPISMDEIGADLIVGSGHKSMASCGPIGVLGMKEKWTGTLLRESEMHKNKEIECMGCSVRGLPLITLMASLPYVAERISNWDSEVEKARWFSAEMEKIGCVQMGEKPHNHDLLMFETDIFYDISQRHPKKRAFLYDTLKSQNISGVKHGLTKSIKISTYGTSRADLDKVLGVFREQVEQYGQK
jgi:Sep-tRNA:Cys-tRNA synthetase